MANSQHILKQSFFARIAKKLFFGGKKMKMNRTMETLKKAMDSPINVVVAYESEDNFIIQAVERIGAATLQPPKKTKTEIVEAPPKKLPPLGNDMPDDGLTDEDFEDDNNLDDDAIERQIRKLQSMRR